MNITMTGVRIFAVEAESGGASAAAAAIRTQAENGEGRIRTGDTAIFSPRNPES